MPRPTDFVCAAGTAIKRGHPCPKCGAKSNENCGQHYSMMCKQRDNLLAALRVMVAFAEAKTTVDAIQMMVGIYPEMRFPGLPADMQTTQQAKALLRELDKPGA